MKTVIEMAREIGFDDHEQDGMILRLAELIRADEREACAEVCDNYDDECDVLTWQTVKGISLQIRARGQ